MNKSRFLLLLALVTLFSGTGCNSMKPTTVSASTVSTSAGSDSTRVPTATTQGTPEIEVVRRGVLGNYNTTTVGKAFEGTFQNAKWTSFVSAKGVTVVDFSGTLKPSSSSTWKIIPTQHGSMMDGLVIPLSLLDPVIVSCIDTLGLKEEMLQEARQGDYWGSSLELWMYRQEDGHPERINKIKSCLNETLSIPVEFQFALSADRKEFSVSYIDKPLFAGHERQALEFIYH